MGGNREENNQINRKLVQDSLFVESFFEIKMFLFDRQTTNSKVFS